jgi:hypothetical protein
MKVLIESYRVRERDDERAILGRVTCDAINTSAAIGLARSLFRTLDIPQEPKAVRVFDDCGSEVSRGGDLTLGKQATRLVCEGGDFLCGSATACMSQTSKTGRLRRFPLHHS